VLLFPSTRARAPPLIKGGESAKTNEQTQNNNNNRGKKKNTNSQSPSSTIDRRFHDDAKSFTPRAVGENTRRNECGNSRTTRFSSLNSFFVVEYKSKKIRFDRRLSLSLSLVEDQKEKKECV